MGQYSGLPLVCQLFISLKILINPEYSLNLVTFLTVPYPFSIHSVPYPSIDDLREIDKKLMDLFNLNQLFLHD